MVRRREFAVTRALPPCLGTQVEAPRILSATSRIQHQAESATWHKYVNGQLQRNGWRKSASSPKPSEPTTDAAGVPPCEYNTRFYSQPGTNTSTVSCSETAGEKVHPAQNPPNTTTGWSLFLRFSVVLLMRHGAKSHTLAIMHLKPMDRRSFLKRGSVIAGAVVVGGGIFQRLWSNAALVAGNGPYGPLQPVNADGLMLPPGSRAD
jgi:hypothetical protein